MHWENKGTWWLGHAKWLGTIAGVVGAMLIALNIGQVGMGFILFTVSSTLWLIAGWMHREMSLVVLQGVFLVIDIVGIYNWAA